MPAALKQWPVFTEIKDSLRSLYLSDPRPWLVGFSGGKDSTMVAGLIFEMVHQQSVDQRIKPISILCADTRVEIPAIVGMMRLVAKVEEFSENNRAHGLPAELKSIIQDDLLALEAR